MYLAGSLETTAASEELRKRCRRKPAHRDESKEGKNRLALPHLHLRNLPHEACVPTKSRPLVLRRVTISEEQGELECFRQPDALEFRGRGESLGRVAPIECSAEAVVSRALGSHERMFARRPSALEGKIRPTRKPSLVYDEAVRPTSVEQLEQRAFTSEKVRALTGLTPRQLQYWDEQKFLSPSLRRRRGKAAGACTTSVT
jgi:hypothetical protein